MYPESLSKGDIPPEEPSFSPPIFDVTSDDYSISDRDSHVTENTRPSRQSRASLHAEEVFSFSETVFFLFRYLFQTDSTLRADGGLSR